jgi:hypothetical protein
MTKLKRLFIKAFLAWVEARQAYANRYSKHRLGS